VVHKLDRFSRNLVDVLVTLDDLQKKGVSFVSATEAILDFTTQIGRFILLVLAFFAQWYVENLSAETTKGQKERFEQGLCNGGLALRVQQGRGRQTSAEQRC
jgi:site-specific DNA recombinase